VLAVVSCAAPSSDYQATSSGGAIGIGGTAASLGGTSSAGAIGIAGTQNTAGAGLSNGGSSANGGTSPTSGGSAGDGTSAAAGTASGGTSGGASGGTNGGTSAGTGGTASGAPPAGGNGGTSTGGGANCVPEICNGIDDDCDQTIDNGCPSTFLRGAATAGTTLGDSTGGGPYSEQCANDEVLVGLQVGFSTWLDQIDVKCQQLSLGVDKSSTPYKYSVKFGPTHLLAPHPATTNDTVQAIDCPAGKVLVGFSISEQHTTPTYTPDYIVLTRVSGTCASLAIDMTGTPPALKWKNTTNIGPVAGSYYDSSTATNKSLTLDPNQVAIGYQGASGLWVDRIGPVVSSVQVLLK